MVGLGLRRRLAQRGRGVLSLCFFALFGAGALVLSAWLCLPRYRSREKCLPLVAKAWHLLIRGIDKTGLVRCTRNGPGAIKGSVLAANHPSLIDVVLLTCLYPNTFSIAKHTLRANPFIGSIVRRVFLPDDEALLDLAPDLLRKGYNILIFPEATRSPSPHDLRPFRRGAAQLAIRAQAPLVPIAISVNRQILAKGQPPTEMGTQTVHYHITIAPPLHPPRCPAPQTRQRANLLTRQSQTCITRLLESAR